MNAILESLLRNYARHFPVNAGKYRLVERFGRPSVDDEISSRRATLKYGGYTMDCDLRKMLQRQFYFFGTYFLERKVLARWTEQAKDAAVVFDIGANAGVYSLAAAASNPHSKIHAFEPTPEIADHLQRTVAQNALHERIMVHRCAVARAAGSAHLNFFSGEHEDNEGMNFISRDPRNAKSIAVPTISIDAFCKQHGLHTVHLAKIDVQGNEPEVLAGATDLIERRALRTVFFELNWNNDDPTQCSAMKAVKLFEQAGYRFADPNGTLQFRGPGPWLHSLSDVVATAGN